MKIKIIITGASGFLGRALRKQFSEETDVCLAVTRKKESKPGFFHVEKYEQSPPGDVLVHLAETNNRFVANEKGESHKSQTVLQTKRLLEKKYSKVIYASSAAIYGDTAKKPYSETAPVNTADAYTCAKSICENMVLDAGGYVVRLSNLYGKNMSKSNVISAILSQMGQTGPIVVKDTSPVRDFLNIEDAARAIAMLAKSDGKGIYNVGSGIATSIMDLAKSALHAYGCGEREIVSLNKAGKHVSYNVLNVSKIKDEVSWHPRISLYDGLRALKVGLHYV